VAVPATPGAVATYAGELLQLPLKTLSAGASLGLHLIRACRVSQVASAEQNQVSRLACCTV
jgi:hypothetical protein